MLLHNNFNADDLVKDDSLNYRLPTSDRTGELSKPFSHVWPPCFAWHSSDQYILLDGYQRLAAFVQQKESSPQAERALPAMLSCVVVDVPDRMASLMFRHRLQPPLSPAEKGIAAKGLAEVSHLLSISLNDCIDCILPLWGERPQRDIFEHYRKIGEALPRSLLSDLHRRRAPLPLYGELATLDDDILHKWVAYAQEHALPFSQWRELTRDLRTVYRQNPQWLFHLFESYSSQKEMHTGDKLKDLTSLHSDIYKKAHPWQHATRLKLDELKKRWTLPQQSQIIFPQALEGTRLHASFHFRSIDEYRQLLSKFENISDAVLEESLHFLGKKDDC